MANMANICGMCGRPRSASVLGGWFMGDWYCSNACSHDAGDRSCCAPGCGCTGYTRLRRTLRAHREQMRVMEDLIDNHGLEDDMESELIAVTGNTGFWLGLDDEPGGMDASSSDDDDPEFALELQVRALRRESADRQRFFDAIAGARDNRRALADLEHARLDLERARMRLEDVRV